MEYPSVGEGTDGRDYQGELALRAVLPDPLEQRLVLALFGLDLVERAGSELRVHPVPEGVVVTAPDGEAAVGDGGSAVPLLGAYVHHGALPLRVLGDELPYDLLPRALGPVRECGVQVQHVVLPAGLVVHPEHVSSEYPKVERVLAGEPPELLPVLVPPGGLVLLPELRHESLPGEGHQRDAVAFHHVEEDLPLLPLGVVLLVVVPVAEHERDLDVEFALLLLVHDGFQEIAGSGAPSGGEPA